MSPSSSQSVFVLHSPAVAALRICTNVKPSSINFCFTMAGRAPAGIPVDKEQIFGMAQQEMEYRVDLFNKLTQTCFDKCVERKYKEADLNVGESSCIDRCVAKYWQVTGIVGQLLGSSRPPMG